MLQTIRDRILTAGEQRELMTLGLQTSHQGLPTNRVPPITRIFTAAQAQRAAIEAWSCRMVVRRLSSMEIIPAIDLLDGACVRLHQGDYDQVTRFSDDLVAQARSWQNQGASRLHLVDLDGAKRGEPVNDAAARAITAALDIPVQLGGGVRYWSGPESRWPVASTGSSSASGD